MGNLGYLSCQSSVIWCQLRFLVCIRLVNFIVILAAYELWIREPPIVTLSYCAATGFCYLLLHVHMNNSIYSASTSFEQHQWLLSNVSYNGKKPFRMAQKGYSPLSSYSVKQQDEPLWPLLFLLCWTLQYDWKTEADPREFRIILIWEKLTAP